MLKGKSSRFGNSLSGISGALLMVRSTGTIFYRILRIKFLMRIFDDSSKQVTILILVFITFNIILLANARLLPFIDLPNHLAEATIYKFYEPGNLLANYYQPTPWYFPNTFHTIFCSLFPSVETGNKVFHVLYIVLLQASVFLVIQQLGGNAWYGALAILFTFNYNVSFGFVGFAISIPFLIILFYTILLYIEEEKFYMNLVIASLLVMLFFMHAQNALMGLVIYACLMLYHFRKSLARFFSHVLLIPLPLVIMIFIWWFTQESQQQEESTFKYLLDYYTSEYFQSFLLRFGIVVFDNFQLQDGWPGILIAAGFFLCIIVPVIAARPWRKKLLRSLSSHEVICTAILFLVVFTCYVFAPDQLPGQTPVFQRFCTILLLSFIIFSSVVIKDGRQRWLKYFVTTAVFVYAGLWAEYIYSFNRENKAFTPELFAGLNPASTLAGLIYENEYRGRKAYIHFPGYYIVWKRGIAASKIIDYRFGVVRRAAAESKLPFYEEHIAENYRLQTQYASVNYLLVRGSAPVRKDVNVQAFSLWREVGPWKIFINTHR